ncbi:hypothetical protein K474DRAFT_1738436 [Panus rudis PR-1116 ss-1]|nr:hypothetical protein K474DRAFT_1738436 [Panus rudis PR-1116 ss-1]
MAPTPSAKRYKCQYCPRKLTSQDNVNRHIQNSAICRERWRAWILSRNWRPDGASDRPAPETGVPADPPGDLDEAIGHDDPDVVVPTSTVAGNGAPESTDEVEQATGHANVDSDPEDRDSAQFVFTEAYPRKAREVLGEGRTRFERWREELQGAGPEARYFPFDGEKEWELADWLHRSAGHNRIEEFLKLPIIKDCDLSVSSKYKFFQAVDELPVTNQWVCDQIDIEGNRIGEDDKPMRETVDLWRRDPVECVRELIGNPAYREAMAYTPERLYSDEHMGSRIFNEMHTSDWWWETQAALPEGATIAPIILASDKTKLSQFRGDQTAWPVYLSIGNIAKATRRKVSARATILLGYIPVSKLECFTKKARANANYRLFHHCMRKILEPLFKAGKQGVVMTCADGNARQMFPILAAYVADHPEQCLVVNTQENRCPKGKVAPKQRGELSPCLLRSTSETLKLLASHEKGNDDPDFKTLGLRPIYEPFWKDLPHCNIYQAITPDILHQLHKGVFKTHLVTWCSKIIGEEEMDRRFKAMPDLVGLRHFKKGISGVSQWTGAEHKEMQKVFVALLAGAVEQEVLVVAKALIDFIYYAQFQVHTSETLRGLESALHTFHAHKSVFIALGIRKHFNIPKLHSLLHYLESIRLFGPLDGFNTELSERLHIDFAKHAYLAGNHKDFIAQMTIWLRRHEAMDLRTAFLEWLAQQEEAERTGGGTSDGDESDSEHANKPSDNTEIMQDARPHSDPRTEHRCASELDKSSTTSPPAFRIAKRCPFRSRSHTELLTIHGASRFLPAFRAYVRAHFGHLPFVPTTLSRYRVYKQVKVLRPWNRFVKDEIIYDRIRATPSVAALGRKQAVPGKFDTVLAIEDHARYKAASGIGSRVTLDGLRAARVRVIFELPARYSGSSSPAVTMLAYVEWFTPFGRVEPVTGMHVVTRSTRAKQPNGCIIPLTNIVAPCHLVAKCGKQIDRTISSVNVLDRAPSFYVNPYISIHEFSMFRLHSSSVT